MGQLSNCDSQKSVRGIENERLPTKNACGLTTKKKNMHFACEIAVRYFLKRTHVHVVCYRQRAYSTLVRRQVRGGTRQTNGRTNERWDAMLRNR